MLFTRALVVLTIVGCVSVQGYYVPGTYPQEFKTGDTLEAHVNSLTSFETELPYEYYTMPFCQPLEGVKRIANSANPGTILQGLRIENSPYNFSMKVRQSGKLVCEDGGYYGPLDERETENLKHKIDNRYRINMLLDNLPVTVYDLLDEDQEFVRPGFELGYIDNGKYYINNHLVFNILVYMTHGEYTRARTESETVMALKTLDVRRALRAEGAHMAAVLPESVVLQAGGTAGQQRRRLRATSSAAGSSEGSDTQNTTAGDSELPPYYMVVGFEVSPCSIKREAGKEVEDIVCGVDNDEHIEPQEIVEGTKIVYTYDVYWQDSKIKWASRWDAYLRMPGGKVHWFSIMNSMLVVVVMASIVATILVRTVRRDLAKYEQLVVDGNNLDFKDEAGWKLLTGDAFRAPSNNLSLAMQVGSGVQLMLTFTVTLLLATLGFLSPASRGALVTTTMALYVWMAFMGGWAAVVVWGLMERSYDRWTRVCLWVSIYYPGIIISIFTLLNLFIAHTGTSGAVPIGMYFGIVGVWFLISIPLTFVGGFIALRVPIAAWPVKTNQIPRHIPSPPVAAHPWLLFLAAGVLPFGTIFIELYFAMTSLWFGYFYYLFGFVFVIGLLTVIINAEIAVLCTYVQLCSEDYLWWWSSFRRGGSVALYLTLYALGFLFSTLSTLAGTMPVLIYLCYMSIFILGFYLAMGTIGFVSSLYFVYAIFGAVKND